jgi:ribulose-phosphate 3-epimerase
MNSEIKKDVREVSELRVLQSGTLDVRGCVSPSLICMDLCNLEASVKEAESVGVTQLHVDMIDGYFSPSMPIGIDVISQLRKKTNLGFDVHLMTMENDFFMSEFLRMGVNRLCFHVETERHVAQKLTTIRSHGVQAGIALAPGTAISTIEDVIGYCDFVLLMMIDPGYASMQSIPKYDFCNTKVMALHDLIIKNGAKATITIDGRVSFDDIEQYVAWGVETLVCGTRSFFSTNGSLEDNFKNICGRIISGKQIRRSTLAVGPIEKGDGI